jgi:hypothetical protein
VDSVEVSVVGPVRNLEAGMRRGWLVTVVGDVVLYTFSALSARLLVSEAGMLVNMNFFAMLGLRTTMALVLVDMNLFLDVGVALGLAWSVDGGREGCVGFFVTFPSV